MIKETLERIAYKVKNNRSIPLVYINRSDWQRHMHKAE